MKRLSLAALLLALLIMLCSCAITAAPLTAPATLIPGVEAELPQAAPPPEMDRRETAAALYFQYMDEPYLAAEYRDVTHAANTSYESALLTELVAGPVGHDLGGLFPSGVRVVSTSRQGRTLFVTLSQEIMKPYPQEMTATYATDEAILRRRLCMQSIVATVTESCNVDQVQILVQQESAASGSLRLEKRYFMTGETGLTGPMTRDESLLLTPHNTLSVILQLCRQQDWQRLYGYLARVDAESGATRPAYEEFVTAMAALPALTEYASSLGTVSRDGQTAAFAVDATLILPGGGGVDKSGCMLRLTRESGLWRISFDRLVQWMEVDA